MLKEAFSTGHVVYIIAIPPESGPEVLSLDRRHRDIHLPDLLSRFFRCAVIPIEIDFQILREMRVGDDIFEITGVAEHSVQVLGFASDKVALAVLAYQECVRAGADGHG